MHFKIEIPYYELHYSCSFGFYWQKDTDQHHRLYCTPHLLLYIFIHHFSNILIDIIYYCFYTSHILSFKFIYSVYHLLRGHHHQHRYVPSYIYDLIAAFLARSTAVFHVLYIFKNITIFISCINMIIIYILSSYQIHLVLL